MNLTNDQIQTIISGLEKRLEELTILSRSSLKGGAGVMLSEGFARQYDNPIKELKSQISTWKATKAI